MAGWLTVPEPPAAEELSMLTRQLCPITSSLALTRCDLGLDKQIPGSNPTGSINFITKITFSNK